MSKISPNVRSAFFICALLWLAACGHGTDDHGHTSHKTADQAHTTELALKLDNGAKWQVDAHTRQAAKKIVKLVDESAGLKTAAEARALATALDKELAELIKGCTMTGPAHDQLHVFLTAFFAPVGDLQEQTDLDQLQEGQKDLAALLVAYREHFE
ncbi:MAG: hypothetical protein GKR89_17465 [Candidatus Latescibacteria bacterium]|nr:hypothetical protein [Candidatus Latescibacterota bacterium]